MHTMVGAEVQCAGGLGAAEGGDFEEGGGEGGGGEVDDAAEGAGAVEV